MFTVGTLEDQKKILQPTLELVEEAIKIFQQTKTEKHWLNIQETLYDSLICFNLKAPVYPELVNELLIQFNCFYTDPQHREHIKISEFMSCCYKFYLLITQKMRDSEKAENFLSVVADCIINFASFINEKTTTSFDEKNSIAFFEMADTCSGYMHEKADATLSTIASQITKYYLSKKDTSSANYYAVYAYQKSPNDLTLNLLMSVESSFLYQWYVEDHIEEYKSRCGLLCMNQKLDECLVLCDKFFALGDHFWEQGDSEKAKRCYRQLSELMIKIKDNNWIQEIPNFNENQKRAEQYAERCIISNSTVSKLAYSGKPDPLELKQTFGKTKTELENIRKDFAKLMQERPVQQVQPEFSKNLRELLIKLCCQIENELGFPPCETFAILCSGSLARGEACPYSDFECVIVWHKKLPLEKAEAINEYFNAFMQLLEFKLFALGETNTLCQGENKEGIRLILKSMKRGLRLDEGGNFPFSPLHQDLFIGDIEIASKSSVFRIMPPDGWPGKGKNLKELEIFLETTQKSERYAFLDSAFLYGNASLANKFHEQLKEILNSTKYSSGSLSYYEMLGYSLINEEFLNKLKSGLKEARETKICDLKVLLLRLPQMLVTCLALFYGIEEKNSFQRIEALRNKKILDFRLAQLLKEALEFAFKLRVLAHNYFEEEKDELDLNKLPEILYPYKASIEFYLDYLLPFLEKQILAWQNTVNQNANIVFANFSNCSQEAAELLFNFLEKQIAIETKSFLPLYQNIHKILQQEEQSEHGKLTKAVLKNVNTWFELQLQNKDWTQTTYETVKDLILPCLLRPLLISVVQNQEIIVEHLIINFQTKQHKILLLLHEIKAPFELYDSLFRYVCSLKLEKYPQRREWCFWLYQNLIQTRPQFRNELKQWRDLSDNTGFRIKEFIDAQKLQRGLLELQKPENDEQTSSLRGSLRPKPLRSESRGKSSTAFDFVQPSKISVKIHSSKESDINTIELHPEVIDKIINPDTGHLCDMLHSFNDPKSPKAYQHRNVAFIDYNGMKLHFKEHPDFPMMAQASYLLSQRLFGHGVAYSDLVIFEVTLPNNQKLFYPVLVSLTVKGDTLKKILEGKSPLSNEKWDLLRLSEFYLMEVIKHAGDGQPRNYVASGKKVPCSVDNEQYFVRGFTNEGWSPVLKEINIIYTLPEFQQEGALHWTLSTDALNNFLEALTDIDSFIKSWSKALHQKEQDHQHLLKQFPQALQARPQSGQHRFTDRMLFPFGVLGKLALDLERLKAAIIENKSLSPKQALAICSGQGIAEIYFNPIKLPPMLRFKQITKQEISLSSTEFNKYYWGKQKPLNTLKVQEHTIENALKEIQCYQLLSPKTQRKNENSINEELIVTLDYGEIKDTQEQFEHLERLIECQYSFETLSIESNCTVLNDGLLKRLLRASEKTLQVLNIVNHKKITEKTLKYLAENCKKLKSLTVSGTSVSAVSYGLWGAVNFPELQELRLNNCEKLTRLNITAPNLTHLSLSNVPLTKGMFGKEFLPKLKSLNLKKSAQVVSLLTEPMENVEYLDLRENANLWNFIGSIKNLLIMFPALKTFTGLNQIDSSGLTVLSKACQEKNRPLMGRIIRMGGLLRSINKQENEIKTFNWLNAEVFDYLEENYADFISKYRKIVNLAFFETVYVGSAELFKWLLQQRPEWNINSFNELSTTIFWIACYENHLELAQVLIEQGTDVNLTGKMQEQDTACTVLHMAYREKKQDLLIFLIQQKLVLLESLDEAGQSVMHYAAHQGDLAFFQKLTKYHPNWFRDIKNNLDTTPLWIACSHGHLELAQYLIEQGADMNLYGRLNDKDAPCSPLDIAALYNRSAIVKYLSHFNKSQLLKKQGKISLSLPVTFFKSEKPSKELIFNRDELPTVTFTLANFIPLECVSHCIARDLDLNNNKNIQMTALRYSHFIDWYKGVLLSNEELNHEKHKKEKDSLIQIQIVLNTLTELKIGDTLLCPLVFDTDEEQQGTHFSLLVFRKISETEIKAVYIDSNGDTENFSEFLIEKFIGTINQLKKENKVNWPWNLSMEVYCEPYQHNNDCGIHVWQNATIIAKLPNKEFTLEKIKNKIRYFKNPQLMTLKRDNMANSLIKDNEFLETHKEVIIALNFIEQVNQAKVVFSMQSVQYIKLERVVKKTAKILNELSKKYNNRKILMSVSIEFLGKDMDFAVMQNKFDQWPEEKKNEFNNKYPLVTEEQLEDAKSLHQKAVLDLENFNWQSCSLKMKDKPNSTNRINLSLKQKSEFVFDKLKEHPTRTEKDKSKRLFNDLKDLENLLIVAKSEHKEADNSFRRLSLKRTERNLALMNKDGFKELPLSKVFEKFKSLPDDLQEAFNLEYPEITLKQVTDARSNRDLVYKKVLNLQNQINVLKSILEPKEQQLGKTDIGQSENVSEHLKSHI